MAFVGSLSGSLGTIAVTGSLIPGGASYDLGSVSNKWSNVYTQNLTGSIQKTAGGNDFIKAGPTITVNYNSLGQWEITGTSPSIPGQVFSELSSTTAFTTSSISIGFNGAASTKGADVFFAVSSSNPAQSTAAFSGPVVASGSFTIKDPLTNNTFAYIDGLGAISGSSITTSGPAIHTGSLTVKSTISGSGNISTNANIDVNGGNITSTAATFNIASTSTTVNIGSSAGKVSVPGDFEVMGTMTTINTTNLEIKDSLIGLGFASGSSAQADGDRGFIGGIAASNNVAFAWSKNNAAFVATKTASTPGSTSVSIDDLQPVRAAKFQVSGSTAEVKGNGSTLQLSGTQLDVFASSAGVTVYRDAASFLTITSGTYGAAANAVNVTAAGGGNALVLGATSAGVVVSGSTTVALNAGSNGIRFQRDGLNMATIQSGSGPNTTFTTSNTMTFGTTAATAGLILSGGNALTLQSPAAAGVTFNADSAQMMNVTNPSSNTVSIDTMGSFSTLNIGASVATNVNISKAAGTTRVLGGLNVDGNTQMSGSVWIGDTSSDRVTFNAFVTSSILPSDDVSFTLGDPSHRWQHIYTGDLHLRNERGDYTLIEEADFLSIRFNKTGQRYKFLLERVPELDE